jgi:hypothetical protein
LPVEISEKTMSQQIDFRLPHPLRVTPVHIIVLLPDGSPVNGVHTNIATQMDGMSQWAGEATADARGQISFGAVEGFEYTVRDIFTVDARMTSEVHFSAADGRQPIKIKLVPKEP